MLSDVVLEVLAEINLKEIGFTDSIVHTVYRFQTAFLSERDRMVVRCIGDERVFPSDVLKAAYYSGKW